MVRELVIKNQVRNMGCLVVYFLLTLNSLEAL